MIGNRREFLKASAAAGVVGAGASEALAASDHWVGVLHSNMMEPLMEEAFFAGLRGKKWEGDSKRKPLSGHTKLAVRTVHGNGKYGGTYGGYGLANAAADLSEEM